MHVETLVKKMTVQEALAVIALHANRAFSKPADDVFVGNIERLVYLMHRHPLFDESMADTRKRVYQLANMAEMPGQVSLLQKAIEALPEEYHETALLWSARMLELQPVSRSAKKAVLEKVRKALRVNEEKTEGFAHLFDE